MFENDSRRVYEVVGNHLGQYSLWPGDRTPPAGWTTSGIRGTKEHCLREISARWTDPAAGNAESKPTGPGTAPIRTRPPGTSGRWLAGRAVEGAHTRLYCFAHSGGAVGEYLRWQPQLPGVELRGVQLPGRGERFAEPVINALPVLVGQVVDNIGFEPPFSLFGHSCGALIAFEVVRELRRRGRALPERLFLSAYPAAHLPRSDSRLHTLGDQELLAAIDERYGGLPAQFLTEPEIVALALPAYRADFSLFETYRYEAGEPLPVPLHVFGGDRDRVPREALAQWHRHTSRDFHLHTMAGDHFYFRPDAGPVADAIRRSMGIAAPAPAPPAGRQGHQADQERGEH